MAQIKKFLEPNETILFEAKEVIESFTLLCAICLFAILSLMGLFQLIIGAIYSDVKSMMLGFSLILGGGCTFLYILLLNVMLERKRALNLITDRKIMAKDSSVRRRDYSKAPLNPLIMNEDVVYFELQHLRKFKIEEKGEVFDIHFHLKNDKTYRDWNIFKKLNQEDKDKVVKIMSNILPLEVKEASKGISYYVKN